jgi:5-hydroxyisourate hydrolase
MGRPGISTHVLDTARGRPAAGVAVELGVRHGDGDTWSVVAEAVTDHEGRVDDLVDDVRPGVYRLWFDVGAYSGPDGFYPEVTVVFRVDEGGRGYHVPLLVSPFGYSTYRGS